MKRVFFFLFLLVFAGCASVSVYTPYSYKKDNYISLKEFVSKNKFDYEFNTLDDLILITNSDNTIRINLLLHSSIFSINGNTGSLSQPVVYEQGMIYLPREIERIIKNRSVSTSLSQISLIKRIVIDPGHGGKDPGAISPHGIKEKDINLQIARLVKDVLEKKGFKVYLTRNSDRFLTLKERVEIARKYKADLFVSIHANANRNRRIKGMEIYFISPKHFNNQHRIKKTKGILPWNFEGELKPSYNTKQILWDMAFSYNNAQSIDISYWLYHTLKEEGFNIRKPKGASFYVLKYAYVPSILVEVGYLTNPYEERIITKRYYQRQIAEAIGMCFDTFNNRYKMLTKNNGE